MPLFALCTTATPGGCPSVAGNRLRRICGFDSRRKIRGAWRFSQAFAEFAVGQLPARVDEAVIGAHLGDQLISHIAGDSTEIEAREKPTPTSRRTRARMLIAVSRGGKGSHRRLSSAASGPCPMYVAREAGSPLQGPQENAVYPCPRSRGYCITTSSRPRWSRRECRSLTTPQERRSPLPVRRYRRSCRADHYWLAVKCRETATLEP